MVKSGEPFAIAQLNLCQYKVVNEALLLPNKSISRNMNLNVENAKFSLVKMDTSMINDFILFGPWFNLRKAKYKLIFDLAVKATATMPDSLTIDLTDNFGKSFYAKQILVIPSGKKFSKQMKYDFATDSLQRNFELRVFLKGTGQVNLSNIRLKVQ